ncbi:MAG: hypothetical protein II795_05175 [Firmicutes bacterium]|nr:hypothetical protein [Bacillota bacterium]
MKKLRRLPAVMIAVLVLLSAIAGCMKEKDPLDVKNGAGLPAGKGAKELYEEAVKRLEEQTALDYTLDIGISHEDGGETDTIDMKYDIQSEMTDGKLSKMVMQGNYVTSGTQGYGMEVYLLDEYFYLNVAGMKIKLKTTDLEDLAGIVDVPVQEPFEADVFTKMTAEEKDGSTVIRFTADGARILEKIEGTMGSVSFTTGGENAFEGITFGEVEGSVTISKDGDLAETALTLPMSVEQETAVITYHIVYRNPGEPVTFEFPDFNGYYDYTGYITGVN